jgi:hypothetical protein
MKRRLIITRLLSIASVSMMLFTTGCQPQVETEVQPVRSSSTAAGARIASTETPLPVGNGRFYIVSRRSGKMLDVLGFRTTENADVVQWGGTGGPNQQWTLNQASGGYYTITGVQSGKALQVRQASTANGTDVTIGTVASTNNQQWQFVPTSNGYYRIVNRNSGKSLDVKDGSINDEADIIQWDNTGADNQEWALLTTQAGGQVSWVLTTGNVPDDVRTRITNAMNDACARYNAAAKWPARTLTVEYNTGVQTADGNTNGNIRFGGNPSYQNTRTAMHEISHTWGVGISGGWHANTSTGPFTGANAVTVMKSYDGPNAVINTGGSHFWPYGLNYDNEWSEVGAFRHVKLVFAMRADGM